MGDKASLEFQLSDLTKQVSDMGDKASLEFQLSDLTKQVSELVEKHLKLKEEWGKHLMMLERYPAGSTLKRSLQKEPIWQAVWREEERKISERWQHLFLEAGKYVYRVQSVKESRLLFGHILPNLESLQYEEEELVRGFTGFGFSPRIPPGFMSTTRIGIPLIPPEQREEEESSKGRSQIIVPLRDHGLEGKLLKLVKGLSKLEEQLSVLEAKIQFPHHPWASLSLYKKVEVLYHAISEQGFACPPQSPKEMDLLRKRMELLCYEAESYKLSAQSPRECFLVTLILTRFESLLKERASMIRDYHIKLSKIKNEILSENKNELSQIQPSNRMFWKLTSFPLEPYQMRDRLNHVLMEELGCLLQSTVEEYPDDIEEVASELDVVSYLSSSGGKLIRNNGDRVSLNQDTFKGKYVWVCCVHVPFLFPWKSFLLYSLINLCDELYSTRDDFEMIMVARMISLANEEEVFNHFFSGFPKSCLAVPFKDKQRRDSICKVVGLDLYHDSLESVLLNPEREVEVEGRVLPSLAYWGAEAFPFTEALLDIEHEECRNIVFGKVRLERVLRCNGSSPDIVYKFDPSGSREEVPISNLEGRHVGLYLCVSGDAICFLREMLDKCREAQLEFEIVVVNMPFDTCTDPEIHESMIDSLLQEHNASGWWRLPFNNSVSMRLLRLTNKYSTGVYDYGGHDMVMVVGPQVGHLDMYGADVMARQGIDAYPFTVDTGIKLAKKQLCDMTLESLFLDGVLFSRGDDGADSKELTQLLNGRKKIMVCIDRLDCQYDWHEQFETIASVYHESKEKTPDFELVFVEYMSSESESVPDAKCEEIISKMPWYVCPRYKTNSGNVRKLVRFFHKGPRCDALVGFGEDGRICSYKYEQMLKWGEPYDDAPWGRKFVFTSLDWDIEYMLGYSDYNGHRMTKFTFPRLFSGYEADIVSKAV